MALDFGAARTGVAVSDPTGVIARPLCVVQRAASANGLDELVQLVHDEQPEQVVVATPLTLRGERGEQARATENFAAALRERLDVAGSALRRALHDRPCRAEPSSAPEDARAAAQPSVQLSRWSSARPGVMPPKPGPRRPAGPAASYPGAPVRRARRRGPRRGHCVRAREDHRWQLVADAASADDGRRTEAVPHRPSRRGSTASRWLSASRSSRRSRSRTARPAGPADEAGYLAATRPRVVPGFRPYEARPRRLPFPATYDFLKTTTSAQLATDQLDAFRQNWRHVDLSYARSKHLTPYDVLIIARSSRRKALAPDERPKIARVILQQAARAHEPRHRRDDALMACTCRARKSLTQSQLASDNPYNTRNPNVVGLPPTPIANPGLAAMQAAATLRPGTGLYFAESPTGCPLLHRQLQRFRQPRASIRLLRREHHSTKPS